MGQTQLKHSAGTAQAQAQKTESELISAELLGVKSGVGMSSMVAARPDMILCSLQRACMCVFAHDWRRNWRLARRVPRSVRTELQRVLNGLLIAITNRKTDQPAITNGKSAGAVQAMVEQDRTCKYCWIWGDENEWSMDHTLANLVNDLEHYEPDLRPIKIKEHSSKAEWDFASVAEAIKAIRGEGVAEYIWAFGDITPVAAFNPSRWSDYTSLFGLLGEFHYIQHHEEENAKRPVHVKDLDGGDWTFGNFQHAMDEIRDGILPVGSRRASAIAVLEE